MRFIDTSKLPRPSEWSAEEVRLLGELAVMTAEERSKAFATEKYRVWAKWSDLLEGLSHGKCWYSEIRGAGARGEVDHFRPKNAVAKEDAPAGHEGYWWLGVLLSNFRFSCQVCNRRLKDENTGEMLGKGTRFPLQEGSHRAAKQADPLPAEQCLLLDPTVKADVDLIWFNEDGTVSCTNPDEESLEFKRVKASRDCYHLDDDPILTKRGVVCRNVKRLAETLEELERKVVAGDADARRTLIERKLVLYEMTRDYAEFSAAARATLKAYDFTASAREILAT